ncbi:fatty acid desaturase [Nitrosomonas sp.]|uniref:DesA family fatty acid desaturase n=1 Tax=Nitrosomonas sp. TaxID=42353 RepID=UPI001D73909A|nr:fatty acid desaturase [Nitrosomonas sp.]MCB1948183.1 fatty acid desaturase [Nitrosomonas sp.]MCP5243190.1 fatty acid desaturase [Burkholderiales bacterium]MDR4513971.1 fatty acid desaturase [Nitrosomonas sp.]
MISDFLNLISGVIDLPWWGYIVVTLVLTHITIASITIYLHRHSAHRALDLHPIPSHFFRFWLWLTSGMVTKEWTAVHRKHHAKCETPDDPHSPMIYGIKKVLAEGAELYRIESKNKETLERYGYGTPDDWVERNIYSKHSAKGIALMLIINVILFGPIGLTIWAIQMMWTPIFAAGVINGIGHYWGYRNFQAEDASRNIVPWGILIGGEELHNNHHAYATSARLSNKWYEFDIGWLYIRLLEMMGLAKVKKVAPKLKFNKGKTQCDLDTLQAVISHRYEVLAKYSKSLKVAFSEEIVHLKESISHYDIDKSTLKRWLLADARTLQAHEREALSQVLSKTKTLDTVYSMREELIEIWQRSTASKDELVKQLEDWCKRAEESGIEVLKTFSQRLRCYA